MRRPPIIVVMGHVDHGKTTLLDYIRKTNLAAREAGGITQAIGAYEIVHAPRKDAEATQKKAETFPRNSASGLRESAHPGRMTFIDTPGHEAFQNMRAHGASIADLAVLVVAADDGVKPQTKEALRAILETKTPYVVAINKIDKSNADIEGTKKSLLQAGVFLEGYGGNISYQLISAKTGEGVNELLDLILLATEMEDLETDEKITSGAVITSRRDPRRGVLTGVILKSGKLRVGQFIGAAGATGRVKSLEDSTGKRAEELSPSSPALVFGFEKIPRVGDEFLAGEEAAVKEFAAKETERAGRRAESAQPSQGEGETLNLVLKADETASLEALKNLVLKIPLGLSIKVTDANVGALTENDVKFAINTKSVIVGFKMKMDKAASNLASTQKVLILESPVIYELENTLKDYARKAVPKEMRRLEVLAVFGEPKGRERIVGGRVLLGPIKNQEAFEIWQDKKLIGTGKIKNLQSQRKDIPQAETGAEAGLLVESDEPIKVGYQLLFTD